MGTKRCPRCSETKPMAGFSRCPSRYDGVEGWCRACKLAYQKSIPEKRRLYLKRYRERHPDRIRAANDKWAHKPEVVKRRRARSRLRMRAEYWTAKAAARRRVRKACRRGELVRPDTCSSCEKKPVRGKIHAHHEDYTKPLEVIWLCTKCHLGLHKQKEAV